MASQRFWANAALFHVWVVFVVAMEEEMSESVARKLRSGFGEELYQTHGVELFFNNTPIDLIDITDGDSMLITFFLDDPLPLGTEEVVLQEISPDSFGHITMSPDQWQVGNSDFVKGDDGRWTGSFNLTGTFLGFSKIIILLKDRQGEDLAATALYEVKVQRSDKLWDLIFTIGMIVLVAIAYVNMGCAIDMEIIKRVLKKPVAPAIGLCSQYLFMPITSYVLGYILFYDSPAQWLGLFMIGSSPGGGGSNLWTYLLGGSLDLSVTMTLVSTIVAFGALPMWVYALATTIFRDGNFSELPYNQIAGMVVGLIVPCAVGVLIKKYHPNTAGILKKMLTPVAVIFIIFASTVGVYINLYIFSFFTWKVIIAGFALPWLGFTFGAVVSMLFRRSWEEVIAISIETGIQNTGLAVGVIKFAMKDYSPLGDITVVIPIAVVTFTPLPLLACLIVKKIRARCCKKKEVTGIDGPMQEEGSISNIHKMTPANSQTPLHKDLK